MDPPIKIAFVSSHDPRDKRLGSGIPFYMVRSLEKHCGEVSWLGPIELKRLIIGKALNRLSLFMTGKKYLYTHSIWVARALGRIVRSRLADKQFDVIFATRAANQIAYLNTDIPIIFTSDTTFKLMLGYYSSFSDALRLSQREGNILASNAIKKARVVFYPSEWAARSAVDDYRAEKTKIEVIRSGANLEAEDVPAKAEVLRKRTGTPCKLLFLGVDWKRKGGEIALDTLHELHRMGIDAELTVCGCIPPGPMTQRKVRVIPFLDKNSKSDRAKLTHLFREANFLLLPTRGETYGVVFCEASAFGVPVVATDTGGVSSVVRSNETGILLSTTATGREYAASIRELCQNERRYVRMVCANRERFESELNWDVWGLKVQALIGRVCHMRPKKGRVCYSL